MIASLIVLWVGVVSLELGMFLFFGVGSIHPGDREDMAGYVALIVIPLAGVVLTILWLTHLVAPIWS